LRKKGESYKKGKHDRGVPNEIMPHDLYKFTTKSIHFDFFPIKNFKV
jgi:hypothetical protein